MSTQSWIGFTTPTRGIADLVARVRAEEDAQSKNPRLSQLGPSIERYRAFASEMLRRADADRTANLRCAHLMLAMDWKELADCTERLLLRT